jgi:alkanesulfonate monooxygenase SsuD/methylene tetrahydromethanopterin reductase-like flavin-dependent oxidoreductase (luciferase family)
MNALLPAVGLNAAPGRRLVALDIAREIERRGFSGIYCASYGDNMALCEALAFVTKEIPFGTAIAPIYTRQVYDFAQHASFIHEVSRGRFRYGVGVSHDAIRAGWRVRSEGQIPDMRKFVGALRAVTGVGEMPPLILAALRKKMVAVAGELGDGVVFANTARSHVGNLLSVVPAEKRNDPKFFIGSMIATVVSSDIEGAKARLRQVLGYYATRPNYRNLWREAGHGEQVDILEKAVTAGQPQRLPELLGDKLLEDVTLFGPPSRIRDELARWYEAGVRTPILVPQSVSGNTREAYEGLLAAFT